MTTTDSGAARAVGRPRSTRAHEAIVDAVFDLWIEGVTVDALTIEAIAAKAGVGKATIYRRWPNKQALLRDALHELKGPPPEPVGDNVRDRILSLLAKVSHSDEKAARIFPCILPEVMRSESAYELWQGIIEPRREMLRGVLREGVASGELRADLDIEMAATVLSGPVVLNRITRWNPNIDPETMPEPLVDLVLAGIAAKK